MVITRGKEEWGWVEEVKGGHVVTKGDLTLGGEHTVQYTDDELQNYTKPT